MALAELPSRVATGAIEALDLQAFAAGISGDVIRPGDAAFEVARQVKNSVVDRHPTAIVEAASAADVARTILFAGEAGYELAVRGGSHSLAGFSTSDGGIVLDLSHLKGLHIDVEGQVAWAGAGLTAGEYTSAAAEHGLATPFGDTGSVGIAGLTLGGGIGWLVRKYGLAIDALLSVEIVTADGRVLIASETEHPDLFWAVRGGGGNFGVVTRFQFRLYPVGMVFGGMLLMPPTRDVLRSLGPIASSAPEALSTISFLMPAPPAPFIPEAIHGQMVLAIMFVFDGDAEAGQAAIEPFRQVATPLGELVMPMPYPGIYELVKEGEERIGGSYRSMFLDTLDDTTIDTVLEWMAAPSTPAAMVQLRIFGGAMAQVDPAATAFAHRNAGAMLIILTLYEDVSEEATHAAWTHAFFKALQPSANGVYSNFLEAEGEDRIRDAYPTATYARLAEVKRRYDPNNLFHLNQNIQPASDR